MIRALDDARRATSGTCCICGAEATQWHRSGRRDTERRIGMRRAAGARQSGAGV